jgi:hypothetical protein
MLTRTAALVTDDLNSETSPIWGARIEAGTMATPLILKRGSPSRRRHDDYDVLEN